MDFARLARNSIHGRDTIAVKRRVQDLKLTKLLLGLLIDLDRDLGHTCL